MNQNNQTLLKSIAHTHNLKLHQVSAIVHDLFDGISKNLIEKQDVSIPGFGKFVHATSKARKAINPITKAKINVPKKHKIKFKMHSHLKRSINAGT